MSVDPITIAKLAGVPTPDVWQRIQAKAEETYSLVEAHYGQPFTRPTFLFDLKGTTAGYASYRKNRIRLNIDILYDPKHQDDMIERTLPHEIAHLVAGEKYGHDISHHGREWQHVMRIIGLKPDRCHSYAVTKARKRKKMARPYKYQCACRTWNLTQIIHRRMKQGQQRYCRDCGNYLREVIE